MQIENIPDSYFKNKQVEKDLFVHDFKMTHDVVKSKVILGMNMFSFLQVGTKQVHFEGASVMVNKDQSLLLKKGNWLWTELLETEKVYYCKLFFFSESKLQDFLIHHKLKPSESSGNIPYFVIKNDAYIRALLTSLSTLESLDKEYQKRMLHVKFEEILLYLLNKHGKAFENYLHSLIANENSTFKNIIASKVHSNLRLEEIAFLCNMSLSTFKRHFKKEYQVSPGQWLQNQRLNKAKEILKKGNLKPSDIYLEFGYSSLANFSTAFKNKFGFSPSALNKL